MNKLDLPSLIHQLRIDKDKSHWINLVGAILHIKCNTKLPEDSKQFGNDIGNSSENDLLIILLELINQHMIPK